MDNCFVDITIEFLAVAFHSILYYASVYPKSVFETRQKYNIVLHRSIHPEVNQYLDQGLKSIEEFLKSDQLSCVEFVLTDNKYKPLLKFVFEFEKNSYYDETIDAYLVQCEQNLRAFCLKISSVSNFANLPEDCSFTIYFHTKESNAVAMSTNPEFEEFPLIEVSEKKEETERKIIPLSRFSIRCYNVEIYTEVEL